VIAFRSRLLRLASRRGETLPGWTKPTTGVRDWTELPEGAQRYVLRLSELIGCEVGIVSTSPDREDTILRRVSTVAAWFA